MLTQRPKDVDKWCVDCMGGDYFPYHPKCEQCINGGVVTGENFEPRDKPPTNSDRIRSMTDEELATFLYNFGDCPCFGVKFCERGTRCEDAVLMKLREPVDNGACSANETSEKVQNE